MVFQYVGPVVNGLVRVLNCFGNTPYRATRCDDKQAHGRKESQKLSIQGQPTTSV